MSCKKNIRRSRGTSDNPCRNHRSWDTYLQTFGLSYSFNFPILTCIYGRQMNRTGYMLCWNLLITKQCCRQKRKLEEMYESLRSEYEHLKRGNSASKVHKDRMMVQRPAQYNLPNSSHGFDDDTQKAGGGEHFQEICFCSLTKRLTFYIVPW